MQKKIVKDGGYLNCELKNNKKGFSMRLRTLATSLVLTTSFSLCHAQQLQAKSDIPDGTIQVFSNEIKWRKAAPSLPEGTMLAVLEGHPKKSGLFTIRLKTPKHMRLAVHQHPGPERVTILQGDLYVGFGDKMNIDVATQYQAGDYYVTPPGNDHYVFTKDKEAVIQITGMGPWEVVFKD